MSSQKSTAAENVVVKVNNTGNFKCFRQVFAALNCTCIGTLTSFSVTNWDIEFKLMLFKSFKIQEFSLRFKFAYQEK